MGLWSFMRDGGKRAVAVWHRRAGKDSTALNYTAAAAHLRKGVYWHMLPELAQGRRVIWDGIDREGRKMIDQAFPPIIRAATNKHEMKVELKNGSIWQVVGSDNYNSLVGANPIGVVFSEWALADPAAWDFIRPILAENGGWAIFIYTARGRNHGAEMFDMARQNAAWFCERLTIEDTEVISLDAVEEEREAGMSDEMIGQEFYCSFDAPLVGSYYGKIINELEETDRITSVPWDPQLPVQTWWDIGFSDSTAIWFVQRTSHEIRVIDYYENSGEGAEHYMKICQEKPYVYGSSKEDPGHLLPHDAFNSSWATGRSRVEVMKKAGFKIKRGPKLSVDDGIQAVRLILRRCVFDAKRCERGIECLRQYRRKWNDALKTFSNHPLHDWSSHGADAFRYGAVAVKDRVVSDKRIVFPEERPFGELMADHLRRARQNRETDRYR